MAKKLKYLFPVFTFTIALFFSATSGAENLKSLEDKVINNKQKTSSSTGWYDYKRGLFIANQENKYIILNFCLKDNLYCNKLDEKTFSNPNIKKYIKDKFVPIKIDAGANNIINLNNKKITEQDLLKQFDVEGYPTIAFLDSQGEIVGGSVKGYLEPEKLMPVLKFIATDAYKDTSFKDFFMKEGKVKSR
jgi:thioredoxin-related protein